MTESMAAKLKREAARQGLFERNKRAGGMRKGVTVIVPSIVCSGCGVEGSPVWSVPSNARETRANAHRLGGWHVFAPRLADVSSGVMSDRQVGLLCMYRDNDRALARREIDGGAFDPLDLFGLEEHERRAALRRYEIAVGQRAGDRHVDLCPDCAVVWRAAGRASH